MTKLSVKDVDVEGKAVLCRVDFNVPMKNGNITDDTRIKASLSTIEYLTGHGARLILMTHLGRPKGTVVESLRVDPIAKRLGELLDVKVYKTNSVYGPEVDKEIEKLGNGEILLLENVRFDSGEEHNDPELASRFSQMADIFVNDAFGTAHRTHASTSGAAGHMTSVAGFLLNEEIEVLGEALDNPNRPFTAIIGGSKVKDKIGVIDHLLDKVDNLLIGGGLACTFLKAQGHEIGDSLLEDDKIDLAKRFIEKAKEKNVNFYIQTDAVVADGFKEDAAYQTVSVENIEKGWMVLDIGPETAEKYREVILESTLIVWNGPMGVFEMEPFSNGTKVVAEALKDTDGYTIIGGGDSAAAIEEFGFTESVDHVSTGGGASLNFMEGNKLPGIEALNNK